MQDAVLRPNTGYFENDELRAIHARATDYARAGVAVHFTGAAGVGKTSLALQVAQALGNPIALMAGNEWLTAHDFLGREVGTTSSTVVDRYVQSIRRTEKTTVNDWRDSLLAQAMEEGQTLIYDEFTRASPEANATLLPVLEEGILMFTDRTSKRAYLRAHADFRIILTSNPHDYLGVNSAPDALMDRMLTIPINEPSLETMTGIVAQRTRLSRDACARIVATVARFIGAEQHGKTSVLRSAILIARVAGAREAAGRLTDFSLRDIATDVLVGRGVLTTPREVAAALNEKKKAA
ncbi:MAG: MoxR family ATPase [Pseudomonadota bacterium]